MKHLHRILAILALLLMLPISTLAADGSITVLHTVEDKPVPGAQFQLYQVADDTYTDAQTAYAAVLTSGQAPAAYGTTDAQGTLVFSGLENGTYLLVGQPHRIGTKVCEVEMSLLTLPSADTDGNATSNVTIRPKHSLKDETQDTGYRVVKVWEDSADSGRPSSVDVKLYRNGTLSNTVTLNRGNNWQYEWTESDPTAVWTAVEAVPEGYDASYRREGNAFYIVNTLKTDTPQDPSTPGTSSGSGGSKLPQTGQLWWPVPVLALMGMILLLLGWLRRKESLDEA